VHVNAEKWIELEPNDFRKVHRYLPFSLLGDGEEYPPRDDHIDQASCTG